MARSKYSKQTKKAAWMRYPIQQEVAAESAPAMMPQKPIAAHADLQLEAWLNPCYQSFFQLGYFFYKSGHMEQAIESYKKAMSYESQSSSAQFNLALAFEAVGRFEEAYQAYIDVIKLNAGNVEGAFGNMLALQDTQYPLNLPRQMANLRLYSQSVENLLPEKIELEQIKQHSPLRIGFISGDLRYHPVGYFLESTLEQIKRNSDLSDRLEFVAYYNSHIQDELTYRISEYFDAWYRVNEWSDEHLVSQIKRDHIDILIDLSGHTRGHRLPVFARKVAPLQISWLGYWRSTGLSAIDYVLADAISVPADEEKWFAEKVWHLPHLRYCFSIPESAPEVSSSPCLQSQNVTFGCYQMLHKINESVLKCWARILSASPSARLRIQSKDLDKVDVKKQFITSLKNTGLDIRRIDLIGPMSRQLYLASYAEVDILLDTFPYPGGTTTAEALWMGVPTITFAVPSMLGRQGEALMINAELSDWVAYSEDEYVQKAIDWANADIIQRNRLESLRKNMREKVKLSPIFNAEQFAHEFVKAMYDMWDVKCRIKPEDAIMNLAMAAIKRNDLDDAFELYQQVISLNNSPDHVAEAFARLIDLNLFMYPFNESRQQQILKLYREHYESKASAVMLTQRSNSLRSRPIRIGFISGDFRNHPISFFLEGPFKQLKSDPKLSDQLELFAYYNYSKQDEYTVRMKQVFDSWHYVDRWSDNDLEEQIKLDCIDVLIDLSGHTEHNRLPLFARKIAPLQVSWLGYWGSTGLSGIDYVLADPITVPSSEEGHFIEKVWKLPHLRYCFSIPDDAPEVSPLPCLNRKSVVFGCYQRLNKLNPIVIGCWAYIMKASPDARIRIQMPDLDDPKTKSTFILLLEDYGFDLKRIDLFGKTSRQQYLASYAEVDIILDTFHFPGGTTTAEALWMGVPTLSLSLPGMLSRQGEALLTNAGLKGWVVYSEQEYIQEAIAWANADESSKQALSALRQGMREKVRNTPVFNVEQFAPEFMDAIYGMWNDKYPESIK